jgi:hypothetical protein
MSPVQEEERTYEEVSQNINDTQQSNNNSNTEPSPEDSGNGDGSEQPQEVIPKQSKEEKKKEDERRNSPQFQKGLNDIKPQQKKAPAKGKQKSSKEIEKYNTCLATITALELSFQQKARDQASWVKKAPTKKRAEIKQAALGKLKSEAVTVSNGIQAAMDLGGYFNSQISMLYLYTAPAELLESYTVMLENGDATVSEEEANIFANKIIEKKKIVRKKVTERKKVGEKDVVVSKEEDFKVETKSIDVDGYTLEITRETNLGTGVKRFTKARIIQKKSKLWGDEEKMNLFDAQIPMLPGLSLNMSAGIFANLDISVNEVVAEIDQDNPKKVLFNVPISVAGSAGITGNIGVGVGLPYILNLQGSVGLKAMLDLKSDTNLILGVDAAQMENFSDIKNLSPSIGLIGSMKAAAVLKLVGNVKVQVLFYSKDLYEGTLTEIPLADKTINYSAGKEGELKMDNKNMAKNKLKGNYTKKDIGDAASNNGGKATKVKPGNKKITNSFENKKYSEFLAEHTEGKLSNLEDTTRTETREKNTIEKRDVFEDVEVIKEIEEIYHENEEILLDSVRYESIATKKTKDFINVDVNNPESKKKAKGLGTQHNQLTSNIVTEYDKIDRIYREIEQQFRDVSDIKNDMKAANSALEKAKAYKISRKKEVIVIQQTIADLKGKQQQFVKQLDDISTKTDNQYKKSQNTFANQYKPLAKNSQKSKLKKPK